MTLIKLDASDDVMQSALLAAYNNVAATQAAKKSTKRKPARKSAQA